MALKFALEAECQGIGVWLDQDQRDKSEAGMLDGVVSSSFFVLYLTQCYFSRWFCKKEVLKALEPAVRKPIILVRETDARHGASRELSTLPAVRCCGEGCVQAASLGAHGCLWPTHCAQCGEGKGLQPAGLDAHAVGMEALNYSLIYGESGPLQPLTVDAEALGLATRLLAMEADPSTAVCGSVRCVRDTAGRPRTISRAHKLPGTHLRFDSCRWYPELEFRSVTVAKLLAAMGLREDGASPPTTRGGPQPESQAGVLLRTLTALGMGCPAPPLPDGIVYHVAIVHDAAQPAAVQVCRALKQALEGAFGGARVYCLEDPGEAQSVADAARSAACVFPFLTLGLLKPGSPAAAAVAAGLALKRRVVAAYETDRGRGGTPSVQELIETTAPEAKGLWDFTAFPWLGSDAEFTEVCALRLLLDGLMDGAASAAPGTTAPAAAAPATAAAHAQAGAAVFGPGHRGPGLEADGVSNPARDEHQEAVASDSAGLRTTREEALEAEVTALRQQLAEKEALLSAPHAGGAARPASAAVRAALEAAREAAKAREAADLQLERLDRLLRRVPAAVPE